MPLPHNAVVEDLQILNLSYSVCSDFMIFFGLCPKGQAETSSRPSAAMGEGTPQPALYLSHSELPHKAVRGTQSSHQVVAPHTGQAVQCSFP